MSPIKNLENSTLHRYPQYQKTRLLFAVHKHYIFLMQYLS